MPSVVINTPEDTSELEYALISQGLVDIQTQDEKIVIDIKYSTLDNFPE